MVGLIAVMSVGTHGLGAVRPALLLRLTAQRHSDDMVIRDYLSHTSPGGSTLLDRITKSGFVSGHSWEARETLGWGTGALGKPGHVIVAWLNSPEHRAIDGRLGQALVERDSPSAGLRAGAAGPVDAIHAATATDIAATAA